jgi:ubiquinone/menaquinone biosynthesis C-methylase UbiE
MSVYNQPLYYEIAFSFVDIKKQIDLFEEIIEKYSRVKVRRVFDIACGPSLQLRELAKRGYEAIGLDISPQMLDYLMEKAEEEGIKITTIQADMANFEVKEKVDFAFIMMGSFSFKNNEDLLRHLEYVSRSLKKGGLYLIENMKLDWQAISKPQSWVMEREGITVRTTYRTNMVDLLAQTFEEILILDVDDHGKKFRLVEREILKHVFPQEFLALLKINKRFEFIGWFERLKLKRLTKASNDNITILRRK